ncbi:DUF2867 domain-containing protein [Streptomyces sp. NPDC002004]
MRLPSSAHTSRPWRIHEIAGDFTLEDVWALPTPGGLDDLARLVRQFADDDGTQQGASPVPRLLFAIRRQLGKVFGWDAPGKGIGARVATLRDRLPADLRDGDQGPELPGSLTSVYLTHDEWAAEIANGTVHAVRHIAWVPDGEGGYRGQMAVLVKPNGLRGAVYMAAIKPFRHLGVYPALIRGIGDRWQAGTGTSSAG